MIFRQFTNVIISFLTNIPLNASYNRFAPPSAQIVKSAYNEQTNKQMNREIFSIRNDLLRFSMILFQRTVFPQYVKYFILTWNWLI